MTVFDRLEAQLIQARRQGQTPTVEILKLVKSDILLASKDQPGSEVSDRLCYQLIYRHRQHCQQARAIYERSGLATAVSQQTAEIAVLNRLLPVQLTDDQLDQRLTDGLAQSRLPPVPASLEALFELIYNHNPGLVSPGRLRRHLIGRLKAK